MSTELIAQEVLDAAKEGVNEGGIVPVDGASAGGWYVRAEVEEGGIVALRAFNDWFGLGKVVTRERAQGEGTESCLAALAEEVSKWARDVWPKSPAESIRDWYVRTCPDDDLGPCLDDVPFFQFLVESAREGSCYVCGVDDSVVRGRLEAALDRVMGCEGRLLQSLIYEPEEGRGR